MNFESSVFVSRMFEFKSLSGTLWVKWWQYRLGILHPFQGARGHVATGRTSIEWADDLGQTQKCHGYDVIDEVWLMIVMILVVTFQLCNTLHWEPTEPNTMRMVGMLGLTSVNTQTQETIVLHGEHVSRSSAFHKKMKRLSRIPGSVFTTVFWGVLYSMYKPCINHIYII